MKKILLLLPAVLFFTLLSAQNFENYFIDKTLRINYEHVGNYQFEKFKINAVYAGGTWNGTKTALIEPTRLGDVLFEVYDSVTNQLIFSRSYSCLFNEYRTTERAKTEIGTFEECVLMPFPKKSVKFVFTTFNRRKESSEVYFNYFNPETTPVANFVNEFKVSKLHVSTTPDKALDILFIPDGYSKADAKLMKSDMKRFANYILECDPYKSMAQNINIRAINGFSEESGITDPNGNVFKKTLLGSSYNVIDLDRYLMCLNVWRMHEVADDAPYDLIIIIANSAKYGGGGIYNFYCTVNNVGNYSDYVIVHELGHLLGGLADEYYTSEVTTQDFYPANVEPVEPNLTTLTDFDAKWKNDIKSNTPIPTPNEEQYANVLGVFEGGGYVAKGVYRPYLNCTMKDRLYNKYCPVCTKALLNVLHYYSN